MRRVSFLSLVIVLICVLVSLPPHLLIKVDAISSFPVHNINTGLNYTTIQSAINAIQTVDGNTIRVDAGTYNETLQVSKGVSITGDNPSTTTINGQVTLSSKGTKIANFTLNSGVRVTAFNCTISNNNIINTDSIGVGVYSTHTDNGIIQNNEIKKFSTAGMGIQYCNGWTISGNDIDDNRGGIILDHSLNCIITENSIHNDWDSEYALHLEYSSYNTIYYNNLFDNPKYDDVKQVGRTGSSSNYWDNGKVGNYWDDYNGTDRGDGIGDIPYVIGGGEQDNFPLMHMHLIPEFQSFVILPLLMITTLLAVMVYKKKGVKTNQG